MFEGRIHFVKRKINTDNLSGVMRTILKIKSEEVYPGRWDEKRQDQRFLRNHTQVSSFHISCLSSSLSHMTELNGVRRKSHGTHVTAVSDSRAMIDVV